MLQFNTHVNTCQYISKVYLLVFNNSVSVPIMYNNLILPYIMIEEGLVVKYIAKIHTMDPYVEDHTKYFPKFGVCITVFMHGVLSYLSTSNPSLATLEVTGEIYLMNL